MHRPLFLTLALACCPLSALADEPDDAPRRSFGAAVGLSGGFFTAVGPSGSGGVANLSPLDFEIEVPLSRTLSVQMWVPLAQLLIVNASGLDFFWTDFFLKWSPGEGEGAYVSPGIGFLFAGDGDEAGLGPEISARIGYEVASDKRGFGFTIGFRPWLDFLFGTQGGSGIGFGTSLELGFHFYAT